MIIKSFSLAGPKNENQDTAFSEILSATKCIALVADGVGGKGGGKMASMAVKEAALFEMQTNSFEPISILKRAHKIINELPVSEAATTASIALIDIENMRITYAHTGDSRIYVLRNKGLKTLTLDQTEVAFLINEGVLTKENAKNYHRKNFLVHSIEKGEDLIPQVGEFPIESGDRILLITDGIYKIIEKSTIGHLSIINREIESFMDSIFNRISGSLIDDATIIAIDVT